MSLDAFVQGHIRRLERHPASPPAPAACLRVVRVAPRSVAAAAGLAPGDLVSAVDGKAPTADDTAARLADRAWTFFRPRASEEVRLSASGIDLGIHVSPTPESVLAHLEHTLRAPDTLLVLWEEGRHAELLRASEWGLRKLGGLFRRLTGNLRVGVPQLLLRGAALYELGRQREGMALVHDFIEHFEEAWTQEWMGVARHYVARESAARGDARSAQALAEEAADRAPESARLAKAAGRPAEPAQGPWVGQRFPAAHPLVNLDTGAAQSISGLLSGLTGHQFLVVCNLASYRGNGPYNHFMRKLPALTRHLAPYWGGLCVVTAERERPNHRPWWFEAEDAARAAGVPLTLLLEDGSLTGMLQPSGAPHFYVLGRDGTVLVEEEPQGVPLWRAVARVA